MNCNTVVLLESPSKIVTFGPFLQICLFPKDNTLIILSSVSARFSWHKNGFGQSMVQYLKVSRSFDIPCKEESRLGPSVPEYYSWSRSLSLELSLKTLDLPSEVIWGVHSNYCDIILLYLYFCCYNSFMPYEGRFKSNYAPSHPKNWAKNLKKIFFIFQENITS